MSFELPDDMLQLLEQDAKVHSVKSRHTRARDIVVQGLSHNAIEDLAQLVGELDTKIAGLKTMIKRLAYVDLVYVAKNSPTDAKAWIREHLSI